MSNPSFYDYDEKKNKGGGGGAFATIVIIIVVLLLGALVVGLFWPQLVGRESTIVEYELTPTPMQPADATMPPMETPRATMPPSSDEPLPDAPAFELPFATPTPYASPTPSPVVDEADRQMPTLDGAIPQLPLTPDNPIPQIFDAVAPGVVGVLNYATQRTVSGRRALGIYGSGSGFIVSTSGYVLTNAHVVERAEKVTVLLSTGDEVDAIVIGTDAETDVAVLKITHNNLTPLKLGDSDTVRVGEYVLAIGNPLDTSQLANTLTFGIISAKAREITIDSYTNHYLQTDAAINFGNSGGPLLNLQGEVIGINSAKTITAGYDAYGNAVNAEGIGFALPINDVREIMSVLITKGQVDRPGIGITVGTVTEVMAEAQGIPVGAYVDSVVADGPAAKAGLQTGDIIMEANGTKITTKKDLTSIVQMLAIGDTMEVRVYRDGTELTCTIVLENKTAMDFNNKAS